MNRENWYDKDLYNMPMQSMAYYVNGKPVPFWTPNGTEYGLESFDYNGETFRGEDIVVVDGEIGSLEMVNLETGYVGLGCSFDYDTLMARGEWIFTSGYRCKMDGMRHATEEEIKNFRKDEQSVGDAAEAADIAWKARFESQVFNGDAHNSYLY